MDSLKENFLSIFTAKQKKFALFFLDYQEMFHYKHKFRINDSLDWNGLRSFRVGSNEGHGGVVLVIVWTAI